jgi:hypothetical protein
MGTGRRLPVARFAVWAVVLGGHVLFVLLLASSRPREDGNPDDPSERTVLLFLDLAPEEEPEPEQQPSTEPERLTTLRPHDRAPSDSSAGSSAIQEEAPPASGPVDWYSEAETVAKDRGPALLAMQDKNCDHTTSDRPGSMLPECGKKRKPPREWEPEPTLGGFEGLLPFVRIGKRCVVGLGFFGCALGKLPEADGHVFDDMNDPDRPTSSVPDIPGKQ